MQFQNSSTPFCIVWSSINSLICIIFGNKFFPPPSDRILLNDLWWAINYSGNAGEEQRNRERKIMQGEEEAGDLISGRLSWQRVAAESIQVDWSWDATRREELSPSINSHKDDDGRVVNQHQTNCGKFRQMLAGLPDPQVSLADKQETVRKAQIHMVT